MPSDAHGKSGRAEYADIGYAIARMFGNAEERAPFAGALQLITTALGYDVGACWMVNDKRVALDCFEYFSRVPLAFPPNIEINQVLTFPPMDVPSHQLAREDFHIAAAVTG